MFYVIITVDTKSSESALQLKILQDTIESNNFELEELTSSRIALQSEIKRLQHILQSYDLEIQELTSSNIALQTELQHTIQINNLKLQDLKELLTNKDSEIGHLSNTIREKNYVIQQKNNSICTLSLTVERYEQLHAESWLELTGTSVVPWKIDRSIIRSIPQHCIGKGAWGEVYSAQYQGEQVAIKYVHEDLLQVKDIVDMIKREIGIMAHIQHPNLVRIIGAVLDEDVDLKRDVPIIVLELLDMNLRVAYTTEKLEWITMLSIFCDVAYALHYLHEQINPIIHRDVSAPNILLKKISNQSFKAKVSDFGSANLAKQSKTAAAGAIIYTAPEMFPPKDIRADPPEQTVKVDVFSYGIVLLEVVCGEMPTIEKRSMLLRACKSKWEEVYDLIIWCTQAAVKDRPTMKENLYTLNKIHIA